MAKAATWRDKPAATAGDWIVDRAALLVKMIND
jgi:hypothetical protein